MGGETTWNSDDDFADGRVVVAQQGHHVFRVGALSEPGEPAQVAKECGNLSAMAFELLLAPRRNDQISHLRRQEAPQPTHALDFAYLIGDAVFACRDDGQILDALSHGQLALFVAVVSEERARSVASPLTAAAVGGLIGLVIVALVIGLVLDGLDVVHALLEDGRPEDEGSPPQDGRDARRPRRSR